LHKKLWIEPVFYRIMRLLCVGVFMRRRFVVWNSGA
jgi:hypothetical protein